MPPTKGIRLHLQSLDNLDQRIVGVLEKSLAIGSTAKQVSIALNLNESIVAQQISSLEKSGKVRRFGRGLWVPADSESISVLQGFIPSAEYIQQFRTDFPKITFSRFSPGVTFSSNVNRPVHRWSSYVQGFSADFVDHIIERHNLTKDDALLDCFSGSGTAPLCAELRGIDSIGIDLSPLMTFVSRTKTSLGENCQRIGLIREELAKLQTVRPGNKSQIELPFLKETRNQFSEPVLESLSLLKQLILENVEDSFVGNLFLLAFASVIVDCSNLKRAPCLGYIKNNGRIDALAPFNYFFEKVKMMIEDLTFVQRSNDNLGRVEFLTCDSTSHKCRQNSVSLAVTSPPYANGLDYVTNYKIELAWLDQIGSYQELRSLRDRMVASDNVSRGSLEQFFDKRTLKVHDPWLNEILGKILEHVSAKKTFRRRDMDIVIQKYFEDMYDTFENVYDALLPGGKFILVVGDSLTAGTYLPTDLILARIGRSLGFEIEEIEFARTRRSGQRRNFELRESIVTLAKQ